MVDRVDWRKRAGYIHQRPRHRGASGLAVRVIGYSLSAGGLLTVILLPATTDPDDTPAGDWWGANAWPSNARDRRIYEQAQEEGDSQ
jgi:hypothetical protein